MSNSVALRQATSVVAYIVCSSLASGLNDKYDLSITAEELMGFIGGNDAQVGNVPSNLLGQVSSLAVTSRATTKKTAKTSNLIHTYNGGCMYVFVRGLQIKGTFCSGTVTSEGEDLLLCNKHKKYTTNPIYEIGEAPATSAPKGNGAKRSAPAAGAARIQPKDIDYKIERLNTKIDGEAALHIEGTSMVVTLDASTKPPTMMLRGYIDDNRIMPLSGSYLEEANTMIAGAAGRPGSSFSINSITKAINMGNEPHQPAAPIIPAPRSKIGELSKNSEHGIIARPRIMPAKPVARATPKYEELEEEELPEEEPVEYEAEEEDDNGDESEYEL